MDDSNEENKKIHKVEDDEYEYTTECPIYEADKFNPLITPVPTSTGKTKVIYSLNLNTYDKGYKPYYPSMDPNSQGGELKFKSKKKIKGDERGINSSANNISNKFNSINKPGQNNLARLMQAYGDEEEK
jgi:hypothetical protein